MKTVTSFVIKRSEWLRGEGATESRLLRSTDGKRCCVGIYARALGVPDEAVCEGLWPLNANFNPERKTDCRWRIQAESEASWLLHAMATGLSELNDGLRIPGNREQGIAAIFAANGVTVTFED